MSSILLNDPTTNWYVTAGNIASPNGNLYIGNNTSVSGNLIVTGNVTTSNIASPNGNLYIGNNTSVSGNLIVTGNITASNISGNLTGNASTATNAQNIYITDTDTKATFFPTFVSATDTNQMLRADSKTGPLTYTPSSSTLSATNFSGNLTGTSSNIDVTGTDTKATFFPTFVSSFTGTNQTLRADSKSALTYNPSSSLLSTTTLSCTTLQATNVQSTNFTSGASTLVKMVSVSAAYTFSNTPTFYVLNMPSPVSIFNLISFQPVAGVNNTLTIYEWRLGEWSGVQNANQIGMYAGLGNGVHLDPFTIRFLYSV